MEMYCFNWCVKRSPVIGVYTYCEYTLYELKFSPSNKRVLICVFLLKDTNILSVTVSRIKQMCV